MTPAHVSVPPSTTIGYGGPRPGDRVEARRGRCAARPPRCRRGPGFVGDRLGGGTRLHPGTLIVRGVDRKDPLQAPPRSTSRSWGAGCFRARRPPDSLTSFGSHRRAVRSDANGQPRAQQPVRAADSSPTLVRSLWHPRHAVWFGQDVESSPRSSGAGSPPCRQGARRRQGRQGAGRRRQGEGRRRGATHRSARRRLVRGTDLRARRPWRRVARPARFLRTRALSIAEPESNVVVSVSFLTGHRCPLMSACRR